MDSRALERVARFVARRNEIDAELGVVMDRPMTTGHLGEWIAAQVFDLMLEHSAAAKGIDGRFASGSLEGRTVNVKWYGKREGILDISEHPYLDYYLVMTGRRSAAASSRGSVRPLVIESVYLFDASRLLPMLHAAGRTIGVATSIRAHLWEAAEISPRPNNPELPLTRAQIQALELFASAVFSPCSQPNASVNRPGLVSDAALSNRTSTARTSPAAAPQGAQERGLVRAGTMASMRCIPAGTR
ncbi:MAG: hypothetical protein ACRDYX_16215 [Egibacteraceae bacterium]